ncbi:MAG: PAS domain-containing protein [Acidobacteria bacterium]|nr:PAS domain-containing protein [Acidobacteriota bacterium]
MSLHSATRWTAIVGLGVLIATMLAVAWEKGAWASAGGTVLLGVLLVLATAAMYRASNGRDEWMRRARAAEDLLPVALGRIAVGVIATDGNGRVTLINAEAQRMTGWAESEAAGKPLGEVLRLTAGRGGVVSRAGVEMPIEESTAAVGDGNVVVFRDVSARRETEARLRDLRGELKQFVSAASHDLRSPLNNVIAVSQLIEQRLSPEANARERELQGYVTGAAQKMRRLLDDMVMFSRAATIDRAAARESTLNESLWGALANLHAEIKQTGAEVKADDLPRVVMEEAHAVQLFQNLIGNAIKYSGAEAPRIHVAAVRNGEEWRITVKDNGMGMEQEYLETIFLPFRRLHGEDVPGSGLGLATCRRIVNGYGGRIWAESVAGEGSKLIFTVPAV